MNSKVSSFIQTDNLALKLLLLVVAFALGLSFGYLIL